MMFLRLFLIVNSKHSELIHLMVSAEKSQQRESNLRQQPQEWAEFSLSQNSLRLGNLTFTVLFSARTRGKVGVHTSCTVWLYCASAQMSSHSRCAHRRILPMWEGVRTPSGSLVVSGKCVSFCAKAVDFPQHKVNREKHKCSCVHLFHVGETRWICRFSVWMEIHSFHRRRDWTSDSAADRKKAVLWTLCFLFSSFFIKCRDSVYRTLSTSSRAVHLEGRQTFSLSNMQVQSNKLCHCLSALE